MIKFLQPLLGVILFSGFAIAQSPDSLYIVSYNVENLFDTVDDSLKLDEEFTPNGKKQWTEDRYDKKLQDIAKVLSSITPKYPDIISLIEIENQDVLQDLTEKTNLKNVHYQIIHEESPDKRGIDVAFLYKPDVFSEIEHKSINVSFPFDKELTTRDILYIKGFLANTDTIHFFINHWPSRRGGFVKSEPKRIQAASILRNFVDSILNQNIDAKIVILGDFNDNPVDESLFEVLKANNIKTGYNKKYLYNLFFDTFNNNRLGSYFYRNNYNMLDNIVLSQSWFQKQGYSTTFESGVIFTPKWICDEQNDFKSPKRTYKGANYLGGYSDHFPVYFVITKNTE